MYSDGVDAVERAGMFRTYPQSGVVHMIDYDAKIQYYLNFLTHEACAQGAMLSLGAEAMQRQLDHNHNVSRIASQLTRIQRHSKLARSIAEKCHATAVRTKTGLLPMMFNFVYKSTDDVMRVEAPQSSLT